MFDESWEFLESITEPPALEIRLAGARCQVAYARGNMATVVAAGLPHCGNPGHHPLLYNLVAIALHHCGRWREAVRVLCSFMVQYGRNPDGYFGLATYLGRALQVEEALANLEAGIRNHRSNGFKALVDTDFQGFWAELVHAPLTPAMRGALQSGTFAELTRRRLTAESRFTGDPMDRKALPPEFGQWMRTNPATLGGEMLPAAPPEIRRRFAGWTLARARASQRLLRLAIRRATWRVRSHSRTRSMSSRVGNPGVEAGSTTPSSTPFTPKANSCHDNLESPRVVDRRQPRMAGPRTRSRRRHGSRPRCRRSLSPGRV